MIYSGTKEALKSSFVGISVNINAVGGRMGGGGLRGGTMGGEGWVMKHGGGDDGGVKGGRWGGRTGAERGG